jgi:DNA-binding XRE family transcriptional regulator
MQRRIVAINVPAMKLYRERNGLSQHDLAKRTGISASSLGRIERGESVPRLNTAEKVAEALGKGITDIWELKLQDTNRIS